MVRISISAEVADLIFDLITANIEAGAFSQEDADKLGEFKNRMSRAVAKERKKMRAKSRKYK